MRYFLSIFVSRLLSASIIIRFHKFASIVKRCFYNNFLTYSFISFYLNFEDINIRLIVRSRIDINFLT